MDQPQYLNEVLIFLLAAVVVVSIFRRLRISSIIGYLIAGVVIGPYALSFISDVEGTKLLAQLGVVFLLFSIGLKLPMNRLQMLKRYVFGLGLAQVVVSGVAIGAVAYLLGQTIEASILIGSALALSSTAVGVQILSERGDMAALFGRVSFSVLLFQDLAVVVLFVMLTTLGQEGVHVVNELGFAALKAGVVLAIIIAVGRVILRPVYRAIAKLRSPELFVAMTLLVVLTTSVTTAAAGLSMELGAFLAGLLLAETEYRHQVEADIEPFHGILLGLFFMTVGMSIDLRHLVLHAVLIPSIIAALIFGKTLIIMGLCRLYSVPFITSLRSGLLLAGGGEFVFVILAMATKERLLTEHVSQILFVVVAISMGLTPLLCILGKYVDKFFAEKEGDSTIKSAMQQTGDLRDHVIIAGFGRVGKLVAHILGERLIPFVAIDNDMDKVSEGRSRRIPVFYGDAKRPHVMRALGADRAKTVVISLNNTTASLRTAMMARKNFENIDVCVRMRDDTHEAKLSKAGIRVIMPENLEPSLQLAGSVLSSMGIPDDEVTQAIASFRRSLTSNDDEKLEQDAEAAAAG